MNARNLNKIMESMYNSCRVSVEEARELAWRKFYKDVGGKENMKNIDRKKVLGVFLKGSEECFSNILENKITEEELKNLIELPPTDIWINEHHCPPINIKKMSV
jgi:hypothetical protein